MVVLAAGAGRRVGAEVNTVLLPLGDRRLLAWSVADALAVESVRRVLVVVRDGEQQTVSAALAPHLGHGEVHLVAGGETRHASERAALHVLAEDVTTGRVDVVAVHDAARPLVGAALLERVLRVAAERGGAVPAVALPGLLSRDGSPGPVAEVVAVQTPQAFRARELLAAYDCADADGFEGTDTAACVARYTDLAVVAVPGSPRNLKVTYPGDVVTAERLTPER